MTEDEWLEEVAKAHGEKERERIKAATDRRRVKLLRITQELIGDVLLDRLLGREELKHEFNTIHRIQRDPNQPGSLVEIPEDLRFLGAHYSFPMGCFEIGLWSQSFESVPEGDMPPEIKIISTVVQKETKDE